jgi:hypothetical protein
MKSLREMRSLRFLLPVVVALTCAPVFAQSDAHKASDNPAPTEAQKSFTLMKALAGTWEGRGTTNPPIPDMPETMQVTFRITSSGHALMHEMTGKDKAKPAVKTEDKDDPVTMFYVDGDRLILTHYCDAGNRPRMTARLSPDGKTIEFEFLDLAGSNAPGHMAHAAFTIIDTNHHTEDWVYMMPGDKPMRAHMDLQRVTESSGSAGN